MSRHATGRGAAENVDRSSHVPNVTQSERHGSTVGLRALRDYRSTLAVARREEERRDARDRHRKDPPGHTPRHGAHRDADGRQARRDHDLPRRVRAGRDDDRAPGLLGRGLPGRPGRHVDLGLLRRSRKRRRLCPDRRLGRPCRAVLGADPHLGHPRLGRSPRRAADAADARRRPRPSERRRGPGAGRGPGSAPPRGAAHAPGCGRRRPGGRARAERDRPPPAHAPPRPRRGRHRRGVHVGRLRADAQVSRLRGVPPADVLCPRRRSSAPPGALRQAHGGRRLVPVQLPAGADRARHARRRRGRGPPRRRGAVVHGRIGHPRQLAHAAGLRPLLRPPAGVPGRRLRPPGHPDRGLDRPARRDPRPPHGGRVGKPRLTGRHAEPGRGRGDRPHPRRAPRGRRHRARLGGRVGRRPARRRATRILWRRRRGASATGST